VSSPKAVSRRSTASLFSPRDRLFSSPKANSSLLIAEGELFSSHRRRRTLLFSSPKANSSLLSRPPSAMRRDALLSRRRRERDPATQVESLGEGTRRNVGDTSAERLGASLCFRRVLESFFQKLSRDKATSLRLACTRRRRRLVFHAWA